MAFVKMYLFGLFFAVVMAPPVVILLPIASYIVAQSWSLRLLNVATRRLGYGGGHLESTATFLFKVAAWIWRPGESLCNWFDAKSLEMMLALEKSRTGSR